jgi:peptidoglycan/LPS O-acetylase OafA/YrhL
MKRIPQLDCVRGIAILAVFFYHALRIKMLWMGVDLFFMLSGFLITGVLMHAKHLTLGRFLGQFYAKRARRILAPYVVTLVLVTVLFGAGWMRHWYLYFFLTNLLFPLHIPHPVPFDSLWSLAVEEQFYFAWPLAVYFLDERKLHRVCVLLIALAPVLRASLHFQQHWAIYQLTPFRMDLLASGALLWIEWKRNRERIERHGTRLGVCLALAGLLGLGLLAKFHLSTEGNTRTGNVFIYESALFICFGFMLYALSGQHIGWARSRPLAYVGRISYSMYLAHLCIVVVLSDLFSEIVATAVGLPLTVAYAAVSWHLMESRLLGRNNMIAEPQPLRPFELPIRTSISKDIAPINGVKTSDTPSRENYLDKTCNAYRRSSEQSNS